jgi:hypothetical protein
VCVAAGCVVVCWLCGGLLAVRCLLASAVSLLASGVRLLAGGQPAGGCEGGTGGCEGGLLSRGSLGTEGERALHFSHHHRRLSTHVLQHPLI